MLLAVLAVLAQHSDSTPYATDATRALIERAIVRHAAEDTTVRDYTSRFRYRLAFGLGRRRWASVPNAAVEEQEGTVQWAAPNDLRVEVLGRRAVARSSGYNLSTSFDQPWFVPRSLGDSVRVFGNEIPRRAAVHPLAPDGPAWYRYRLTDSVRLTTPQGRRLELLAVEVIPRRIGASLVAGRLWLDAGTADLVRCSFRFVGTGLWIDPGEDTEGDSGRARKLNRIANRILTLDADLEYALQEDRYWMPYRQVVSGRVELPWFGEIVIPFEARTTFEDHAVNTGRPIAFSVPLPPDVTDPDSVQALLRARRDSLRQARREHRRGNGRLEEDSLPRDNAGRWANGRYEIHRAPADSLRAYAAWGDSLSLSDDPAEDREVREVQSDLERLAVDLPPDLTGRRRHGFTWDRIAEAIRYNRIQGWSPGLGYEVTLPGDGFTTLRGEARFGLSDERAVGGLILRREAPGARWTLRAYRDVLSNDPFSRANRLGNSLNALFVGHDDGDYLLAHGARLTRDASLGTGLELSTSLLVERETSVRREARSWLNDALGGSGRFPDNPPVTEGTFGGAAVALEGVAHRARWLLAGDLLAGEGTAMARAYGSLNLPFVRSARSPILALRAGVATRPTLTQQAFRVGGSGTVRGFDYGTRGGSGFWAAQLEWPLTRGLVQPVLFADAGQGAAVSDLFSSSVIAGGGAGLSFLGGLVRFDLSHPFTSGGSGLRFDLVMRGWVWPL